MIRLMKTYINLLLVLLLVWSNAAMGQSGFDPAPPEEPNSPPEWGRVVALASPDFGGKVDVSGMKPIVDPDRDRYVVGYNVTLTARPETGFVFVNWMNDKGEVVSENPNYSFVKSKGTEVYTANFEFAPGRPSEPDDPYALLYYTLTVKAGPGGSVSGGGRYRANTNVWLYAYADAGYAFAYWKNDAGEIVSRSQHFSYTTKAKKETLTAVFTYEPGAPTEPDEPILRHKVTLKGTLGVVPGESGRELEGKDFYVSCNVNPGYKFLYWMKDGEVYTALQHFYYTIGKENTEFYAVAVFDPDAPAEPPMAELSSYAYYLMTVNGKPGDTVEYPIYLNNSEVAKDMNIRLTFPAGMEIDVNDYALSDKAEGYSVSINEAYDDYSIIEEGSKLWDFTLMGGTTYPGTQALLTFKVRIPEDMPTGVSKQVKINQISMTKEDGTSMTAHTRNGRIGVYKLGDSNGDNTIDIADKRKIIRFLSLSAIEDFIKEVADVDDNGKIDVDDARGIITIIKDSQKDE